MQNQVLSMFLDMVMAGLLLATIIYCLKLNRRIRLLQDSKSELARIIREFDESTTRATQNINEIHTATMRISDNIQMKIDKANYLANDLEIMIERGNKMAGKIDTAPARSPLHEFASAPQRGSAAATPGETNSPPPAAQRSLRMRSRAERELMNLLGGRKQDKSGG